MEGYGSLTGLPQGDAASPMVLALKLAKGVDQVSRCASGDELFQAVYIDNRFIAAKSDCILQRAIHEWAAFSAQVHLLESPEKIQLCNLSLEPCSQMEVLGALIGGPSKQTFYNHPKHRDRINSAKVTARRIAFLPLSSQAKMTSLGMFSASKAVYGWVHGRVPHNDKSSYNSTI